jgi:prepilin-type N-terminal cleavage/methylation domain-containing protein
MSLVVSGEWRVARKGFTLIEVLVVTVIVAVISLAIFSTLNSGLKIWHRVHATSADEDLAIFFLRFGSDARSTFAYGNQTVTGTSESVEMPSLDFPSGPQPGVVVYSYNSVSRTLCRWRKTRSQVEEHSDGAKGSCLDDVERCAFSYYANDTQRGGRVWLEEWRTDEPPLAVRVEIARLMGGVNQTYTKTAFIPVATYPHEKKKN